MSHLRPAVKHKISACKRGRHNYGMAQNIGAGITRQVCPTCGTVTIDLTAATDAFDAAHVPALRAISSLGAQTGR
jgi:hypothetical protein